MRQVNAADCAMRKVSVVLASCRDPLLFESKKVVCSHPSMQSMVFEVQWGGPGMGAVCGLWPAVLPSCRLSGVAGGLGSSG